jgi:2-oxoisovalerate dehydrogenase E1 component alpha subunit
MQITFCNVQVHIRLIIARVHFPGAVNSRFTSDLQWARPSNKDAMPTYRVLNQDGATVDKSKDNIGIPDQDVIKMYLDMLTGKKQCGAVV